MRVKKQDIVQPLMRFHKVSVNNCCNCNRRRHFKRVADARVTKLSKVSHLLLTLGHATIAITSAIRINAIKSY